MITLVNGALSLGRQNGGHLFANWNFGNYDLTLTDPATLFGTAVLDHSDLTISGGPLDNNGTLIAEDGSDLTIQNNLVPCVLDPDRFP
jgi:adhesin HecA-like repeat protein